MLTDDQIRRIESAWAPARSGGVLGGATIEELQEHAAGFVPAASFFFDHDLDRRLQGIDMGTGVGIPGIFLAVELPGSSWRLVDARVVRCELARRAVAELGLGDRVTVVHGRVDELGRDENWRGTADLVVARLFGPPAEVAECGVPLLAPDGLLVVSVSAETARIWRAASLDGLGVAIDDEWQTEAGRFLSLRRSGPVDERFPRRAPTRRRRPLF